MMVVAQSLSQFGIFIRWDLDVKALKKVLGLVRGGDRMRHYISFPMSMGFPGSLILRIAIIIVLSFCGNSRGEWTLAYTMPVRSPLNDVVAADCNTALAVGDSGCIMITNNGGRTWDSRNSGTQVCLKCCGIQGNSFYVVGDKGVIVRSNDSGRSWILLQSGVTSALNGIWFSDQHNGWAVGDDGVILHSPDGGLSWVLQGSKVFSRLNKVMFADKSTGWCVGEKGVILATKDGGQNWIQQKSNTKENISDIAVINTTMAYLSINSGLINILKTTDGGDNWVAVNSPQVFSCSSICFISELVGWGNSTGYIYSTKDGGASWNRVGVYSRNVNAICFADANKGWAVGGPAGGFIASTDNNTDWAYQLDDSTVPLNDIYFKNANEGYAVGGELFNSGATRPNIILRTIDGGRNWTKVIDEIGSGLYDVFFLNERLGWTVSRTGLYKSTDGGQTWQFSKTAWSDAVFFTSEDRGWATGLYNGVWMTRDGGSYWDFQWINSMPKTYFQSLFFVNDLEGWAAGYHYPSPFRSIIAHTIDGGYSWEIQNDCLGERTWLCFTDQLYGWAVTDSLILHTINGGQKWLEQNSINSNELYRVHFADRNNGWVVGAQGTILKTSNGGTTWWREKSPTKFTLYSVFAINPNTAWACGDGVILKNENASAVSRPSVEYPAAFDLRPCYPNPFNQTTIIPYELRESSHIIIIVYNFLGERVRTLAENFQASGSHEIAWDSLDEQGKTVASGVYLVELKAAGHHQLTKVTLIK